MKKGRKSKWNAKEKIRYQADIPPPIAVAFDEKSSSVTGIDERKPSLETVITWAASYSKWLEVLKEMKLEYLTKMLNEEKEKNKTPTI